MSNINNTDWSISRNANYKFFEKQLANRETGVLYDLGAGPTQFKKIFHRFTYVGVDFGKYEHVSIVTDLREDFPIDDNVADVVTISAVLEHIPNTEHFLSEIYRILKRGGVLVGTVPWMIGIHQEPHDYNRYTPMKLEYLLHNAGFKNINVETIGEALNTYNQIELKTFDYLRKIKGSPLLEIIRFIRRAEMRFLRKLYPIPASYKLAENFGFVGYKIAEKE